MKITEESEAKLNQKSYHHPCTHLSPEKLAKKVVRSVNVGLYDLHTSMSTIWVWSYNVCIYNVYIYIYTMFYSYIYVICTHEYLGISSWCFLPRSIYLLRPTGRPGRPGPQSDGATGATGPPDCCFSCSSSRSCKRRWNLQAVSARFLQTPWKTLEDLKTVWVTWIGFFDSKTTFKGRLKKSKSKL